MNRTFLVDLDLSIEFFNLEGEENIIELMFEGTYKYWPETCDSPEDHQIYLSLDEDSLIEVESLIKRRFFPSSMENNSFDEIINHLDRIAVDQFLSDPSSYLGTW